MHLHPTQSAVSNAGIEKAMICFATIFGILVSRAYPAAHDVVTDYEHYGAVAFSKSTGKYAYSWNKSSKNSAFADALAKCKHKDAEIVGWVCGGWLAVAMDDHHRIGVAAETGNRCNNLSTCKKAMHDCEKHGRKVKTLVLVFSGNYSPFTIENPDDSIFEAE